MSKGSRDRTQDKNKFNDNYDRIFNKDKTEKVEEIIMDKSEKETDLSAGIAILATFLCLPFFAIFDIDQENGIHVAAALLYTLFALGLSIVLTTPIKK